MSDDSEAIYYYSDGENAIGPFSLAKLKQMADGGIITIDTYVAQAESDDWKPLRDLSRLPPKLIAPERPVQGTTVQNKDESGKTEIGNKQQRSKWRIYLWYAITIVLTVVGIVSFIRGNIIIGLILVIISIRTTVNLIARYRNRTQGNFIKDLVRDTETEAEKAIQEEIQSLKSAGNGFVLAGKIALGFVLLLVAISLVGIAFEFFSK